MFFEMNNSFVTDVNTPFTTLSIETACIHSKKGFLFTLKH